MARSTMTYFLTVVKTNNLGNWAKADAKEV